MTDLSHLKARILDAEDRIKHFAFTAGLGNPASMRIVDEARRELAAAERELADLDKTDKREVKNG
jgi:hypothetical protein